MADDQWYCLVSGQQYGPVAREELVHWLRSGRVQASDYVWNPSMDDWKPASAVPGLVPEGVGAGDSSPPQASPPPHLPPGGGGDYGGYPPHNYQPGGRSFVKEHRGGLILALGILSWVVCCLCGMAAWSMGNNDLKEMDAGVMDPSGRSLTQAGRIVGMISVILSLAIGGFYFLIMVVGALAGAVS